MLKSTESERNEIKILREENESLRAKQVTLSQQRTELEASHSQLQLKSEMQEKELGHFKSEFYSKEREREINQIKEEKTAEIADLHKKIYELEVNSYSMKKLKMATKEILFF